MEEKSGTCTMSDTSVTSTTSFKPTAPGRQVFQQALRDYNQSITEIIAKIDRIAGRNGNVGTLSLLKQSKQEPRKRREQLKHEADEMKVEINEIKRLLAEKDSLLSDIENDLVYRDENRLTTRLKELEDAHSQTKFTSSRDEKALVKEINKLKRNRAELTKYNTIMEARRVVQLQLCGIIKKRSNVLKSIREITNQLDIIDRYIRQQRRDFLQLKDSFCDLHARKKKLVDSYNKKRKEYIDWSNRNIKDVQCSFVLCSNSPCPKTYPVAHRHQSSANFIDDETLEPLYEQKVTYEPLIKYLTSLQSRMHKDSPSPANDERCRQMTEAKLLRDSVICWNVLYMATLSDSAEEYPPSFSLLKQPSLLVYATVDQDLGKETSLINVLKRKCNKSLKKPCQEIIYPMQRN